MASVLLKQAPSPWFQVNIAIFGAPKYTLPRCVMTSNTLQDIQLNLKKRLGEGIAICIDELWRWLNPSSKLCNDLIQLQRRFNDAKKDFEKGTIDYRNEYEKVRNQVHEGISTLIDSLRLEDLRILKSGPLFDALLKMDVDEDLASRPVYLVN
jgi:hypothetical protein